MKNLLSIFHKKALPSWRTAFRADMAMENMRDYRFRARIEYFFLSDTYSAVLFYRLSSYFHHKERYYWKHIFYRLNVFINACSISWEASIGEGLKLPHPAGVVIGERVTIGRQANIHHHVTMGRRRHDQTETKGRENEIVLGDNVVVYAGAVIVAGVHIGNNVEIGANSVVLSDVPDDCVAVGIPAHIIKRRSGTMRDG